jgi:Tol biopolymer transport system component
LTNLFYECGLGACSQSCAQSCDISQMTTSSSINSTLVVSAGDIATISVSTQVANHPISVSHDGHLVAFASSAALEASDTNGKVDIYVKDFNTNTLRRASVAADGKAANGASGEVSVSADGRYVVFGSAATNLVTGDTNQLNDVFVKDLQTGVVQLVSGNNGSFANAASGQAVISADGRFVSFVSSATNLVPGATSGQNNVYLKNLDTGALSVVSSSTSGVVSQTSGANAPSISANGRYVAFASDATDLIADPGSSATRIYLKDTQTGAISFTMPTSFSAWNPQISADGQHFTFDTSFNFSILDTNGAPDGYLRNPILGSTRQVSPSDIPGKGHGQGEETSISSDATRAVFTGSFADFVGNQDPALAQVYVRDISSGVTVNLSQAANVGNTVSGNPVISGDGKSVVFVSNATQAGGNGSIVKVTLPETLNAIVGNDRFDDLAAADQTFSGGAGDDLYVVRNAVTQVNEVAGQGNDRLVSLVNNYTLPLNVEQLTLGGSVGLRGIGNEQNNILRGNGNSNVLEGLDGSDSFLYSGGNDTFDGGTGIDTAVYGLRLASEAVISQGVAGRFTVQLSGQSGSDSLVNVERIQFSNKSVALDIDGASGQAFRLYQAAFGRTPDLAGLGYWINRIDNGTSLLDVSRSFIGSGEFQSLYGVNPSHIQIVDLFYQNVLHRAPDAGGQAYWVGVLDNNPFAVPLVLQQFSESLENKTLLLGTIQNGIDYIPFS